jgi:hypothetical protein
MKVSQSGKFRELCKFLEVLSLKLSTAMMKLALRRIATGKEDPELPLLQRISSLELTTPQTAAQINVSQSSSNRHISTSTIQRRLCESGLHGRIAANKPLQNDTKKQGLGPRNTLAMDIRPVKSVISPNLPFLAPTTMSL